MKLVGHLDEDDDDEVDPGVDPKTVVPKDPKGAKKQAGRFRRGDG